MISENTVTSLYQVLTGKQLYQWDLMKDDETYRRASNSVDNCIKHYLSFPVTFCEKA